MISNAKSLNERTSSISVLLNQTGMPVTGALTASPEPSNVTYPFTLQANLTPPNPADTLSGSVSPNCAYTGQTVGLAASTTPSGTTFPTGIVTFLEGTTVLGAGTLNSAGQASFSTSTLPTGTHTITAAYPGDTGFLARTSAPVTLVITAADAILTTDRSVLTIQTEHHGDLNVALASVGLGGTFTLACGPLPAYASCYFGSASINLPVNGKASTSLDVDTDAVYHFKSSLELLGKPRSTLPLLALTPLAWLAAGLRRKRAFVARSRLLRAGFLPIATGCFLSGCGDKYPAHTAPGSYTIQVIATSIPGTTPVPLTRKTSFTLVVTP